MAEQEACASAVTEALGAAGAEVGETGDARGESLLLPLLQGLLGGGGSRLLAGLGAAPADVVADVRRSLGRLRAALAPPAAHPQARALLALADRLEDALDAADRLDGCRRRPRRRTRAARHTVGVTREELDQARRLVDRDGIPLAAEPLHSSAASSTSATGDEATPERNPSLDENGGYRRPPPVNHSVSYEPPSPPREAPTVERRAPAPRRPDFFRHSMADAPPPQARPLARTERRPSETKSSIAAIANKFDSNAQMERRQSTSAPRRAPVVQPAPKQAVTEDPQRTFFRPLPPTYNFAAPPTTQDDSKPSRFGEGSSRKLRMKRANTIDIGRSLADYRQEEEEPRHGPPVPEFRPQTENDKKFVAFMKKNEARDEKQVGQANWSSRFGNIKHAFESREREEPNRAASASSSARKFWSTANEAPGARRGFLAESNPEIIKPPWVTERREPARINGHHVPRQVQPPRAPLVPPPTAAPAPAPIPSYVPPPTTISSYIPPLARVPPPARIPPPTRVPPPLSVNAPTALPPPPAPIPPPTVPQSPTHPVVVKPFAARPIPVNQFSHAPMSAFKPPAKIASPTMAPAYVWSPPSLSAAASPSTEYPNAFPPSPRPLAATTPPAAPWQPPEDKAWKPAETTHDLYNYEQIVPATQPRQPAPAPLPPPPTHALPTQNFPVTSIPSQNELAAPELVRRVDEVKYPSDLPAVDAQKLQIEFYERQIREKNTRRELPVTRAADANIKPPAPVYSVTDYTPKGGISSTFVPLQRTPDIEKARAHKVDYLPDVVTNETDRQRSPAASRVPPAPRSPAPLPPVYRNGDAYTNGTHEESTTEHEVAVTRVMRGPVRGAATITTGVRTRNEPAGAADALRGALDKISSPKRDLTIAERKRREAVRSQVRAPALNGRSPPPAPHVRPSPPSLGASRESVASSGSAASAGSALSRSGSWHQLASAQAGSTSPRRVVARAKSMHLLAVPKLYEGGIARDEVTEKRRSVEAYFAGQPASAPVVTGTRSPARRARGQFALGRSRTMSALTELQFLDESNADDAFEDLVSALA